MYNTSMHILTMSLRYICLWMKSLTENFASREMQKYIQYENFQNTE